MKEAIRDNVRAYFEQDIDDNRNIYFKRYNSSKEFNKDNIQEIISKVSEVDIEKLSSIDQSGYEIRIDQSPVLIWRLEKSKWLIIYSSSLPQKSRNGIDKLSSKVGWLLEIYFDNTVIDSLYNEFSPNDDSVNIKRRWDPYWLYQNSSDVPDEFLEYYQDNIKKFVEKEIEFNLKTPKWMVDDTLKQRVDNDLLEKSDISKTQFTFLSPKANIRQDGGTKAEPSSSGVTVRQEGQIVHRQGNPDATFEMVGIMDDQTNPPVQFEEIFNETEYEQYESGIIDVNSYGKNKILKVEFPEKKFDKESSITLSNLLTVGQSDVDLHGVIKGRDGLEFLSETYTAYDCGKYEILFTGEGDSPCIYIKPISGTPESLEYIYKKVSQKFDSRTVAKIVDNMSDVGI
ncbi:hypothetical protein [Halohasta litorea]|uniref:Uncharacterized protein n=1 Tax=Halohasta litorea TaxID=869891 RepID=A0ABD6D9G4_9EURY|nr:hypothetical protein [Halohasta litorea]